MAIDLILILSTLFVKLIMSQITINHYVTNCLIEGIIELFLASSFGAVTLTARMQNLKDITLSERVFLVIMAPFAFLGIRRLTLLDLRRVSRLPEYNSVKPLGVLPRNSRL